MRRTFDEYSHQELSSLLTKISIELSNVKSLAWASTILVIEESNSDGSPPELTDFLDTAAQLTLEIVTKVTDQLNEVL